MEYDRLHIYVRIMTRSQLISFWLHPTTNMSNQPVIAVDMDDVLCSTNQSVADCELYESYMS